MPKPKVFVTRLIPAAAWNGCGRLRRRDLARAAAAAGRRAAAEGRRLRGPGVAADRPDRRGPARRGPAAARWSATTPSASTTSTSPAATDARHRRRQHARRADRRHGRHGVRLLIAAARRIVEGHQLRASRASGRPGSRSATSARIWPAARSASSAWAASATRMAKRCHGGWDMKVLYHDHRSQRRRPSSESGRTARRSRHAAAPSRISSRSTPT